MTEVLATAARDILKSLVDANAALIGFLGLFVVFALNSYREEMRRIQESIFNVEKEHRDLIRETKKFSPHLEREYELFTTRVEELQAKLKLYKENVDTILMVAVLSALCFVVSITFSLLSMGEIEPYLLKISTGVSSVSFVVGVFLALLILIGLKETL